MSVKYGMADLMLVLKDTELKVEAIPLHIYQGMNTTKKQEDKCENPQ